MTGTAKQIPPATAFARLDDPATSHLAAESVHIKPSWRHFARLVLGLDTFTAERLTTHATKTGCKYTGSRLRTCMKEWEERGWLTYTTLKERTQSGRLARVATLTKEGRTVAHRLVETENRL